MFFGCEMLSKCIDSGYLVGATLLSVFFLHGMKMYMWFGYNSLIIIFHLLCFVKVHRQWVPCGHNFPLIVLKLCRCFLHGMKMCMWFWYNPLIFFSLAFQFSVTNLSFSSDSTVAGL